MTCQRDSFWSLLANSENSTHDSLTRKSSSDDFHHFSPPPPAEFSSLELSPKKHVETHQTNNTELRSGVTALQLDLTSSEEKTNGIHPIHGVNGMINSKPNGDKPISSPAVLLSPAKEPPPVLAKPKLWVFCFAFFSCKLVICWKSIFARSKIVLGKWWKITKPFSLMISLLIAVIYVPKIWVHSFFPSAAWKGNALFYTPGSIWSH